MKLDKNLVRKLSTKVYELRLGEQDAREMREEVGEKKFQERAKAYDELTHAYIEAMDLISKETD